jgi:AraC family transcriptional regulator, regulatory protein of adaptative response / DNA-3-methyladenine glycosylase II
MSLDLRVCSRARLARDARFDGKFFIGVITTRIYCRPICRSRTSLEKNVRYFPTAAAAEEAGFRPCLRCRPECSPATTAWAGTKNTVSRALRLISESGLEDGGVEALAAQLGIGSRHLRRLFLQHVGATPRAVAQSRRLHFAKKLIDETRLPMTQIAIASGFGSVRRFNATIRKTYQRTPTQIRALARRNDVKGANEYRFQLSYRPPYDWKRMLDFLAQWATPGVEVVDQEKYRRTISVGGSDGYVEVSRVQGLDALGVRVRIAEPRALFSVVERIRAMFDLDADWVTIARTLGRDRILRERSQRNPGLRVPGCWSGFELAVRTIRSEGRNAPEGAAAAACMVRGFGRKVALTDGLTHLFPTPEVLATADLEGTGVGSSTAETIRTLARAVAKGAISFERVVDPDELVSRMDAISGMGELTREYLAMRALRDPDAFPSSDGRIAQALGAKSQRELQERSLIWRPWRAYAAIYLWSFAEEIRAQQNHAVVRAGAKVAMRTRND